MISILDFSCHFIEKGITHYKCDPFFKFTYLLTLQFCRKPYTNLDSFYNEFLFTNSNSQSKVILQQLRNHGIEISRL